jgi:hypothetical protein
MSTSSAALSLNPSRKLSGLETFGEAQSHRIEIGTQVAEKGNFATPDDLIVKPQDHRNQEEQGYKVRGKISLVALFLAHGGII